METERRNTPEVLLGLLEEGRVVVQGDVRLAVVQPVVPAGSGWDGETGSELLILPAGRRAQQILRNWWLPEQEGDIAVLALSALHGAVQGQAGVSEGQVVQLAVHVVGVEALEAAETSDQLSGHIRDSL